VLADEEGRNEVERLEVGDTIVIWLKEEKRVRGEKGRDKENM